MPCNSGLFLGLVVYKAVYRFAKTDRNSLTALARW
jgi:hypothetical protein